MAKKKKTDTKEELQASKEGPATSGKDEALEYAESIINTVREPLLSLNQDLRVVTASRSFYDFFKVKPEETVGQLIYDLGNKQWDIPKLRELLETILPQKASFDNYEVEHDFATIGKRIMLLNARQIQRGSEKERIILLAIEDITERKDIETGLEKTRKELAVIKKSADEALEYAESIINTVREPLLSLNQDLRVVSASRSFYEVFKVNPEETVGQLIYDLGNKQWDIPKLRELLETILPQKASFDNYEVEHDFTTIGKRIMLLNARQIQRGQEKERIILLAIEDITERKQAEMASKISELRYRRLFETAEDGILIIDAKTGMIDDVNPFMVKMLGYSHEKFIGRTIWEIGFFKDIVANKDHFKELQIKEYMRYEDIPLETADGRRVEIEFVSNVYFVNNKKVIQCNIRDISKRKIKEALQESKEHFRTLVETSPEAITLTDLEGRFIAMNPQAVKLYGFDSEDEVLASELTCFDFVAPTDRQRALGSVQRTIEQGPVRGVEVMALRRDGTVFPIEVATSMIYDKDGKPRIFMALTHDITERKQAEKELRESKALFEAVVENVPHMISLKEATDLRLVIFNHAGEELLGHDRKDLLGKNNLDLFPPEQAAHFMAKDREVLDGEVGILDIPEELIMTAKKGQRLLHTRRVCIKGADGTTKYLLGISEDITEHKRAEEEIESLAKFPAENPNPVLRLNRDDIVIYANPNSNYLLKAWNISIGSHIPDFLKKVVDRSIETGEIATVDMVVSDRVYTFIASCVSGENYINLYGNNITNQKQAEEALRRSEDQLRQSQKMEAIGRLAGGIAHDFNNMIVVINGYSEMAIESLKQSDPLRKDLEEIFKAGQRSAELTRQLLAFSRKQVLAPEILDINKIVAGIEPMLRRLIGEDINLAAYPADDLGKVNADPGQIEQVIMNLAVNSRDAMPKGGKLTVETSNIELDEEYTVGHPEVTPGQYVMVSVADTGCGMDAETIEHIFEPFYTTKEQGKGTGLGLSTVFGIVKQSGGNIYVYSEPGKGTTFKIYLPRELSTTEAAVHEKKANILTTGTETILVVEDELGVRNLTKRVLEASGYTVHTAASGGEALLICERIGDSIHLMLTDIVMPEMSGRELAERLIKICPNMKVLYMSGYTEDTIVHHGVLDQNMNFISKPFSLPALTVKVREVLDK